MAQGQRDVMGQMIELRRELVRAGVLADARISWERSAPEDEPLLEFVGVFRDAVNAEGHDRYRWVLGDSELRMDRRALRDFIERIQHEARHLKARADLLAVTELARRNAIEQYVEPPWIGPPPNLTATEVLARQAEQARHFAEAARNAMVLTEEHFRMLRRGLPQGIARGQNTPAHRKARELFIKTAGMEAYAALNEGRAWPVTGSAGTAYELTKRASFCIKNPATQVEYCAVVPGVPIWDHLLGIKLMVEHDEPRFLATANSSIGVGMMRNAMFNNPRNWNP